jgi:hypothetical protein
MAWIRLFHRATRDAAKVILRDGFRDRACRCFPPAVWLSIAPLDCREGTKMGALLEVLVDVSAEQLFYDHEVIEADKPYREFLFGAAFLNDRTKCTVRVLTPEEEDSIRLEWNEYPPGEPERTWAELRVEDEALSGGEQ